MIRRDVLRLALATVAYAAMDRLAWAATKHPEQIAKDTTDIRVRREVTIGFPLRMNISDRLRRGFRSTLPTNVSNVRLEYQTPTKMIVCPFAARERPYTLDEVVLYVERQTEFLRASIIPDRTYLRVFLLGDPHDRFDINMVLTMDKGFFPKSDPDQVHRIGA